MKVLLMSVSNRTLAHFIRMFDPNYAQDLVELYKKKDIDFDKEHIFKFSSNIMMEFYSQDLSKKIKVKLRFDGKYH